MSERPYEVVHVDELDRIPVGEHGLMWRPVRRRLGIEAFGVNAYSTDEAGQEVVEHHDETGTGAGRHEELYVVVRGHARFTLDGQEVDAPAGTCVFVRERSVKRGAHAVEPGTTVLALGGKPGEVFEVSPWEYYFAAIPAYRDKDYVRDRDRPRRVGALPGQSEHPLHTCVFREPRGRARVGARAPAAGGSAGAAGRRVGEGRLRPRPDLR